MLAAPTFLATSSLADLADKLKSCALTESVPGDIDKDALFQHLIGEFVRLSSLKINPPTEFNDLIRAMSNSIAVYGDEARLIYCSILQDLVRIIVQGSGDISQQAVLGLLFNLSLDYEPVIRVLQQNPGFWEALRGNLELSDLDESERAIIHNLFEVADDEVLCGLLNHWSNSDKKLQILASNLNLLKSLLVDQDDLQIVAGRSDLFPSLVELMCDSHVPEEQRDLCAQIVSILAGNDELMLEIFQSYSELFYQQLSSTTDLSENVYMYMFISLGNICRTDANCISMGERHPGVFDVIHSRLCPSASMNMKHAALGLLRNLTRVDYNRILFLSEESRLLRLVDCMSSPAYPIQMGSLGVLKNISRSNEFRIIPAILDQLISMNRSSDEEGVVCESARILASFVVVRTNELINGVDADQMGNLVSPLNTLISSQHTVLIGEGISAVGQLFQNERFIDTFHGVPSESVSQVLDTLRRCAHSRIETRQAILTLIDWIATSGSFQLDIDPWLPLLTEFRETSSKDCAI